MKNIKNLKSLLRLFVSVSLLLYVFSHVELYQMYDLLKTSHLGWILLAFVPFVLSQWLSSIRLLGFMRNRNFLLSPRLNLKLYFVGMFYNFFIPGGIGGDAYKIYYLHKKFSWSIQKLTSTLISDRASGLLTIFILIMVLLPSVWPNSLMWLGAITAAVVGIFFTYIIILRVLGTSFAQFSRGVAFSLGVQMFQIIAVICIIHGLSTNEAFLDYVLLFLLSSLLSIFSVGGVGIREFVFFKLSSTLKCDVQFSVSIGLIFNVLSLIVSLYGFWLQLMDKDLNSPSVNTKHQN